MISRRDDDACWNGSARSSVASEATVQVIEIDRSISELSYIGARRRRRVVIERARCSCNAWRAWERREDKLPLRELLRDHY
jgi:hypothetical protein